MNFYYHFVFSNKTYLLFSLCMGRFDFNQFLNIECCLKNSWFLMVTSRNHSTYLNFSYLCLIISSINWFSVQGELGWHQAQFLQWIALKCWRFLEDLHFLTIFYYNNLLCFFLFIHIFYYWFSNDLENRCGLIYSLPRLL
jgi:hypothetical protein